MSEILSFCLRKDMGNSFSTSVVVVDGPFWLGGQVCARHPPGHQFEASL